MHKSKVLQNEETQVPNTPEINDRDIANEALSSEKSLAASYTTIITEASNDYLFKSLFEIYQDTVQAHRNIYNLMFTKGWYKVETENVDKLDMLFTQFKNYKNQIQ